METVKRKAN